MLPADEKALEHSKSGSRDPDIVYGAQNRSDAVQPTTTLEYDNKEANASAERVDSIAMTTAEKPEPEPAGVSWRLKCLILICMLAVPGKLNFPVFFYRHSIHVALLRTMAVTLEHFF